MRAATRPGGDYRGRHHLTVLAHFRPTWLQATAQGLAVTALTAVAAAVALAAALLAPGPVGDVIGDPGRSGYAAPLAAAAPLAVGLLALVVARYRPGPRFDDAGVYTGGLRSDGFTGWRHVADIRAERRRRRTVIAVYAEDGSARRLRAPYDGHLLGHDPHFERKLFMINHLWETHRDWSVRG